MRIYTPLVFLCISSSSSHHFFARALRNISLDYFDPAIVYHGNWLRTPYDPDDIGGYHMVAADSNAFATLAFTGVAIYFYSPLWPFRVTTAVSLDGDHPVLLDLRDYDVPVQQDGGEAANSSVVWYTDGLVNIAHVFNVSVGDGEDLAVVNFLQYTILEPGDPSITTASVSYRSVSVSASASASTQPTTVSTSSTKIGLSITLGLVCVIFTSIVLWAIFWWWKRRHRRRLDELSTSSNHDHPPMSEATTRYPRTTGIPSPARIRNLASDKRGPSSSRPRQSSSSRRSSGSSSLKPLTVRGVKKALPKALPLSPIPEASVDHANEEEEDSESQGSATTTTTTATSPELSVKFGEPRNDSPPPPPPQHETPTVRLVTNS